MTDSPALSPWEHIGNDQPPSYSDLYSDSSAPEYDSDDSWDIVTPRQNARPCRSTPSPSRQQQRHCSHWADRNCSLEGSGLCCACSDRRVQTKSGLYSIYVDGQGWVDGANRWAYYCPGCKEYEDLSQLANGATTTLNANLIDHTIKARCSHFSKHRCSLMATRGKCCACSDDRAKSKYGQYSTYVDGEGCVQQATRWAHYCPGCKAAHRVMKRRHTKNKSQPKKSDLLEGEPLSKRLQNPKIQPTAVKLQQSETNLPPTAEKHCVHWAETQCSLTRKQCCSCSDARPIAESYPEYVDGSGWVLGATRWAHYCPGCKDHLEPKQHHNDKPVNRPRGLGGWLRMGRDRARVALENRGRSQ
ncbi:hypothetical protein BJ170DRAFT_285441 [Xylariales sp. AK1849]|nr:hypothetical protein BJ170DRAFT_285441 [Xylariales sp. AK1849]